MYENIWLFLFNSHVMTSLEFLIAILGRIKIEVLLISKFTFYFWKLVIDPLQLTATFRSIKNGACSSNEFKNTKIFDLIKNALKYFLRFFLHSLYIHSLFLLFLLQLFIIIFNWFLNGSIFTQPYPSLIN